MYIYRLFFQQYFTHKHTRRDKKKLTLNCRFSWMFPKSKRAPFFTVVFAAAICFFLKLNKRQRQTAFQQFRELLCYPVSMHRYTCICAIEWELSSACTPLAREYCKELVSDREKERESTRKMRQQRQHVSSCLYALWCFVDPAPCSSTAHVMLCMHFGSFIFFFNGVLFL